MSLSMPKKEVYQAIATLMGTLIGAGVLGIPFVVAEAGFLTGVAIILLLGFALMLVNFAVGEITLRTNGNHQLAGYAGIYLGKKGKFTMLIAMFLVNYGALIAYIVGVGQSLFAMTGILNPLVFSFLYWIIVSMIVYIGLKAIKESELDFGLLMLAIILIICSIALLSSHFSISNLGSFDMTNVFIPYGVVLFSFLGSTAVPELKEILTSDRKYMQKAIFYGTFIPMVLYIIFAFAVVGVLGSSTTSIATIGLGELYGNYMVIIANIFAVFAMTTSLLALGLALKEVYNYDLQLDKNISWVLTMFIPMIIIFLGVKNFIHTIDFVGSIAGGIQGILLILVFWKAVKYGEREPEYKIGKLKFFGWLLMLVFALGILYQILHRLGLM